MNDSPRDRQPNPAAGLCASCRHVTVVVTDRGRAFVRCRRSVDDPRFLRYPVLPVIACPGYERREVG
jgi:hypothetical protein